MLVLIAQRTMDNRKKELQAVPFFSLVQCAIHLFGPGDPFHIVDMLEHIGLGDICIHLFLS